MFLGLVSAASRDPELSEALRQNFLDRPRAVLRELLGRALARGEIRPGADLELVSDILLGLNLVRMLLGEVPDRDHGRRVLDRVVYPLVTGRTRPRS